MSDITPTEKIIKNMVRKKRLICQKKILLVVETLELTILV